ncbi:MAG: flagellar hook assembly protein FlgD [Zoogloeaceae bacterium]|jgi:flagellar basal-body rod modification protein FlgD|nr:flagellar hook assembly protein FlgD [Zoogloeaceae bacterium]
MASITNQNVIDVLNSNAYSAETAKKDRSAVEEMSDRFMTLFLTQLRHQDPLNPMENAEMTSQLAQMNMVSGLENLNVTMKTLLSSYGEALSLQAANLVGKNVLVPGNSMTLGEQGALFGIQLKGPADQVEVTISDQNGNVVAKQSLGQQEAGSLAFFWDGTDSEGNSIIEASKTVDENGEVHFTPSQYTFTVSASLGGEAVEASALQAGTVSALIRGKEGAFALEVAGLGNYQLEDVQQVF